MRGLSWRFSVVYVVLGLLITGTLVSMKIGFERTILGAKAERASYEILTSLLPRFRRAGTLVTVLDISRMKGVPAAGALDLSATPRAELMEVMLAVAALRPTAIGVDADFSPTPNGWVQDSDPKVFFSACLKMSETTPVVLGVFRSLRERRDSWLGLPRFAVLAGGMWMPDTGPERMPVWTHAPGVGDRLPSLGGALAAKVQLEQEEDASGWRQRFTERAVQPNGLVVGEVLVDFSSIGQMRREVLRIDSVAQIATYRDRIERHIVIIGNLLQALDRFPVPGEPREVEGILLHAAIVNTLMEPIWELSHKTRLVVDISLSLIMIFSALVISWRIGGANHSSLEKAETKVLRYLIAVTVIGGFVAVWYWRLLWLDFLLVAVTLMLHPWIVKKLAQTVWGRRLMH